ncbi:S-adenosyl-L-methionine-dependent methyltransferase [Xylaria palmicola]|nr:S-adenosyl-L-methionine-dependent methyltransferase [Xylaria palmicola]
MAGNAADINRSIFNEEAASYDDKHRKLNARLTRELQARLDFIGVDWASDEDEDDEDSDAGADDDDDDKPRRQVRLLDYACGTGMMSRALIPYTTQCIGMDVSEGMVAAYNTAAENQGLSPKEMHAVLGDLAAETVSDALSSPELFNFDIAVVGGGFHHFGDPALAAKRLVERLRPGGVLLIWDFLPHGAPHRHGQHHHHGHHQSGHDGHGHGHEHSHGHGDEDGKKDGRDVYSSVMHHGFSEAQMREIFAAAGAAANFRLEVVGGGFVIGHGKLREEEDEEAEEGGGQSGGDDGGEDDKDRDTSLRRQVFLARGTKAAAGGER